MQSATAILTGNLPAEPNSFIGRERDLAELARLLGEVRALTLSGPGGIGKTRLAVRLARGVIAGEVIAGPAHSAAVNNGIGNSDARHSGSGPDSGPGDLDEAWLVELADWHGQTAQQVAATIGIREEQGVPLPQTLAEALRSRRILLILDTCEHQVGECATLVQLLLARCPWLRIIATSREPLRVRGETVWRVPPLDLPPDGAASAELAGHEAVRLFAARAAGARPGFTLTSENTASVARLCRTLDGIPLGIELSAARVRALSVEQIADRLRDRFQLLNSGDRTAPLRQQTLRATVDWSYELLEEQEQILLRRLATFSGWNLDMAEQVCSDEATGADAVLGLLISLIDKSLVVLDGEAAGDARYRLLDTIKQYAAERLDAAGEKDALALRHRDCILALVEETARGMFNRGEPPWPVRREVFRRGIAEYGNFRIALETSLAHGYADEGLRLCIGLRNMWLPHGDAREAATWLDRFLVLAPGEPGKAAEVSAQVRGRALACRAEIAFDLQDYDTLMRCATESLELSRASGDDFPVPTALRVISQAAARAGRADDAVAYIDEAVAAAEAAGNDWEAGLTQATRAAIAVRQGKLKSAQRAYEAALEVLSDNNRWGVAQVEYGMGTLARNRGDAEMAVRYYADAMEIFREIDAWPEIARCQAGIGWIALTTGDYGPAAASLAEALRLNQAGGQRLGIARGLEAFAALAAARQQPERAARLAGAACQLRESLGHGSGLGPRIEQVLEFARARLGAAAAAALFAEGRETTPEDAVGYALGSGEAAPEPSGAAEPAWTDPARLNAAAGPRQEGGNHRSPDPLTPREHEIALLIARGLSNREIADDLVISPATAARHVANILAKLGFTSRTQIASWATRHEPPS
jgi:predicted ATPase/DNA-binding CsgD family transcriptional regulator/Tfp pilus assembly protein PilF